MTFKLFIKVVLLRHGMEGKVNRRWFSMSDIIFVSHFLSDILECFGHLCQHIISWSCPQVLICMRLLPTAGTYSLVEPQPPLP